MFTRDVSVALERVRAFNAKRPPKLLARKYERMSQGGFPFLRGACHLFYEDWRPHWPAARGFRCLVTGDLHLENFGVFKTYARNFRYDINDFDETALAFPACDLARLLSSIVLAAGDLGFSWAERDAFARAALSVYTQSLAAAARSGAERFVDEKTSQGPVHELLTAAAKESRADLLAARSEPTPQGRRLKRSSKLLDISPDEREALALALQRYAHDIGARHSLALLDAGFRVAGTGSLGLRRYAALVEGKGGPDGQLILDVKEATASALLPFLPEEIVQPRWAHHAERVVRGQRTLQGDSPAYLGFLPLGGAWFVVKELQPTKDRLQLAHEVGAPIPGRMEVVVRTAAQLTAWSHARAVFEGGDDSSEALLSYAADGELGRPGSWSEELITKTRAYCEQVSLDLAAFREAWRGWLG